MRPPLHHRQETGPAGLLGRIRTHEDHAGHAGAALATISAPAQPAHATRRRALQTPGRAAFAKLMVTMIVVAAIASLASGTFASFNAVTQNSSNTFQTGTVLLSATQPNDATACVSYGVVGSSTIANNNVNTCPVITFAGVATGSNPTAIQGAAKPSDAVHAHLTVQNVGTLNASNLLTYSTGTATCTTANNPNTGQHGSATDLCSGELQFYVQEYTTAGFTTPVSSCIYPVDAANACTSSPSYPVTLGSFTQHVAGGSGATAPLAITNGLTAGQTRYLDVVVTLPASAPNTYQGLQAQFNLIFQLAA